MSGLDSNGSLLLHIETVASQTVGHSALEEARSGQLALLLADSLVFVGFMLLRLLGSLDLDAYGLLSWAVFHGIPRDVASSASDVQQSLLHYYGLREQADKMTFWTTVIRAAVGWF